MYRDLVSGRSGEGESYMYSGMSMRKPKRVFKNA